MRTPAPSLRHLLSIALTASLLPLPLAACGSSSSKPAADTHIADTTPADTAADAQQDAADIATVEYTPRDYFPAKDTAADEVLSVADLGLTGSVRVIYEDRGIPHIYGDDVNDMMRSSPAPSRTTTAA